MAELLGVDRTTMVALVDTLQSKGLVERGRQPDDRRKNVLGLTKEGRDLKERGGRLIDECEDRQLKNLLGAVIAP